MSNMDNDTQLAAFENENENGAGVEHDRSRALLVVGVIAALMLAILIIALAMTKPANEREVENMVRAGSPEFDAYKDKVAVDLAAKRRDGCPHAVAGGALDERV